MKRRCLSCQTVFFATRRKQDQDVMPDRLFFCRLCLGRAGTMKDYFKARAWVYENITDPRILRMLSDSIKVFSRMREEEHETEGTKDYH